MKNGVTFYNDSCATNPHATVYSIKKLSTRGGSGGLILITGGADKNLDYQILAERINKHRIKTVLLEGSATKKIAPLVNGDLILGRFSDLSSTVREAAASVGSEGADLFSPASASFEMFQDEFERGEKFKQVVRTL